MIQRVLIIDDNLTDLKLEAQVLESDGLTVHTANDAEAAQELLSRLIPDVILMDIALPGMDGLMLTRLIKSDERLKHVPVIALTAFAMKGDDRMVVDAGCDGYITKPIDTRRFTHQVRGVAETGRVRIVESAR